VNVVVDFIGAPYIEQNLAALAPWGRLVFLSTLGGADANVNLSLVMMKRIQIRGCTLRTRTLEEKLTVTRLFAAQVVPLLMRSQVRPIVEQAYPLHEIAEAHRAMGENRNFGKLILTL
jgi:NADPH2:quinone reductase